MALFKWRCSITEDIHQLINASLLEDLTGIIQDCINNNRLSQEKLYRLFYPSMFCLCKKFFSDDHAALEAVNDGMIKVFRNLPTYQSGKGAFFNWVYTIVRHTALDKLKKNVQEMVDYDDEGEEADNSRSIVQQLEWKDIYRYLDHLPTATRPVFSLFYLESYSVADIAKQLQISPGTVKWHLSESRKIMQPVLKKHFSH